MKLLIRLLWVEEGYRVCSCARQGPHVEAVVPVKVGDGVGRICVPLKGQNVLEGNAWPRPAVGVPHGKRDGGGPVFPGTPAAGQVLGHGPLEVPHEERVDDGVHGAIAVTQPRQHVKEVCGDAVAGCLQDREGGERKPSLELCVPCRK